jgi:uncharacterized protein (UPF0216 family)
VIWRDVFRKVEDEEARVIENVLESNAEYVDRAFLALRSSKIPKMTPVRRVMRLTSWMIMSNWAVIASP